MRSVSYRVSVFLLQPKDLFGALVISDWLQM